MGVLSSSSSSQSQRVNVMLVRTRNVLTVWFTIICCSTALVVQGLVTRNKVFQPEATQANRDLEALLLVKASLVDNSGVLSTWDGGSITPCNWTGVICRARDVDTSQTVVVSLVLRNCKLSGTISSSIGLLEDLETLHLGNNLLTGPIPVQIGNLSSLRLLDLSFNSLSGSLPSSLGNLGRLEEAIFDDNDLTGEIPSTVQNLLSCIYFSVQGNKGIGGLIPVGLKTIPELNLQNTALHGPLPLEFYDSNVNTFLYLNNLNFSGSGLPDIGRLQSLRGLYMKNTKLDSSPIPESLANSFSLEELDLSENSFVNEIPSWIATLPNLKVLLLSNNKLTGSLPQQLGQNSELSFVDISGNNLNGTLPEGLCSQATLESLNLSGNQLEGQFPSSLVNCKSLFLIDLGFNYFSGNLPSGLGLSFGNLSSLNLSYNSFVGTIPWEEFASLTKLTVLDLSNNRLWGDISSQVGSFRRLQTLDLSMNMLTGSLPPHLANCTELQTLQLQGNLLNGAIPVGTLSDLEHLVKVNLADNRLEGNVESGISSLSLLQTLNVSRNSLIGSIPSDFGSLRSLQILDLSGNRLSGEIPDSLRGLESLQTIDLSYNLLSGSIPSALLNLQNLVSLNLSYNMFSGSVPQSRLSWPSTSFLGNKDLCVTDCSGEGPASSGSSSDDDGGLSKGALAGVIVGSVASFALILGIVIALCMRCCTVQMIFLGRTNSFRRTKPAVKPFLLPEIYKGFSYPDIMTATRNLSEDNIIGRGGYGTVYRGDFPNNMTCAVKQVVLEQESSRSSFQNHLREVEIAGQTRHKNIVNLIGFCQKGDETLIVYELMPNGSLGDALHRRGGTRGSYEQSSSQWASTVTTTMGNTEKLNWRTRFNILCGAARALDFMHNECRPPILHRDLKSNNILLDSDFEARITDFGMAKMVENAGVSIRNMALVTGSAGYLAPEYYRHMKITDKSDVYSFGVVILETLTGMYPTENATVATSEEFSLVHYVISTLRQEGVLEAVLDTALQEEVIESQKAEEQMTLVLQIGLLSTVEDPPHRLSMREVVEMLEYSKGEHGRVKVPELSDLLQDLTSSPPDSPKTLM